MNSILQDALKTMVFGSSKPTKKSTKRSRKYTPKFSPEYLAYLHSPDWKEKRAEVFRYYGRSCAGFKKRCGAKEDLQVDHKRYPPRGSSIEAFKNQSLADFQVLCRDCHNLKTKADRKSTKSRSTSRSR